MSKSYVEQTTYNHSFQPEVLPYATGLFGDAAALTDTNKNKWQKYKGDRNAQFTDLQKQSFEGAAGLGRTQTNRRASAGLMGLARRSQRAGDYDEGNFRSSKVRAPRLRNYQMRNARDIEADTVRARNIDGAQARYKQDNKAFLVGNPDDVRAPTMKGANARYDENLKSFQMRRLKGVKGGRGLAKNAAQMKAAQMGKGNKLRQFRMDEGRRVKTDTFDKRDARRAMSPYMQNVVDIQQREAQRQADVATQSRNADAVRSGAFGGSRQAIMDAEAARNLQTQKGDIQATGLQSAYERAQQQYNTEQGMALDAAKTNKSAHLTAEQANLQSKLQTQGLQTNTELQRGLANLNNRQQSNVQNQAAKLQMQGMSAQQALQAALANQQTELARRQGNQQASLSTQQLGSQNKQQLKLSNLSNEQQARVNNQALKFQARGMNSQQALQAALANQQSKLGVQQMDSQNQQQLTMANLNNRQQAAVQNVANRLQAQGMNQQQAMQAALANQQTRMQTNQQNLQANMQTQGLRAGNEMTAQQLNQQGRLQAGQLNQQDRQFGANFGQQALQNAGQMYNMANTVDNGGFNQNLAAMNAQNQYGTQQQNAVQQGLNTAYGDWQDYQNWEYKNQEHMANILYGSGNMTQQTGMYSSKPQPSWQSQALGTMGQMYGMSQMGKAGGGLIDLAMYQARR